MSGSLLQFFFFFLGEMYKEAFGYTLSEHAEGECVTHAHTSERDTERERGSESVCVFQHSPPLCSTSIGQTWIVIRQDQT